MLKNIIVGLTALILSCGAALSATPILSGKYTVVVRLLCQPTEYNDYNSQPVVDIINFVTAHPNYSNVQIETVTFSPTKGKFTFTGFIDEGSVFLLLSGGPGGNGQTLGEPLNETPTSGTLPYSNTATTVTVNGDTFNAIYGQIDKNSIAHTAVWMGLFNGGTCSLEGEATRQ